MSIELVFESHSWSQDNDRGVATGWLPGQLSERGRGLARELGERRRSDGLAAVFTSDLRRAVETAALAFADSDLPVLVDWRLRECDYGQLNGAPAARRASRVPRRPVSRRGELDSSRPPGRACPRRPADTGERRRPAGEDDPGETRRRRRMLTEGLPKAVIARRAPGGSLAAKITALLAVLGLTGRSPLCPPAHEYTGSLQYSPKIWRIWLIQRSQYQKSWRPNEVSIMKIR